MGNQEAKQRKASAASGNGSYPSLDEGWREGGGDTAKKGGKKLGKHGGKGASSSGGGGGMQGTGPAKKKNKSEPKSSVFSIRKRKGNLKGKGDACLSVTGSKEDVLSSQHDELGSTKTPEVSADELGQSDTEAAFPEKKTNADQRKKGGNGGEQKQELQRKALTTATSPTEDGGQKGGSSGSDTDIYSFHSAADHEDLLADIQLAISLQHQQQHQVEAQKVGERDLSWGRGEGQSKQSNGGIKLTPPEVLDLTPELELGSDALSFLETGTLSSSFKHMDQLATLHIPSPADTHKMREGKEKEEAEHLVLNGRRQREREREAFLCVATGTKDQHAWLQQPPHAVITMATAEGAVSPVTMTTSGNSLPDLPFDSSGKTLGEQEKAGGESQQEAGREPEAEMDLSPPTADSSNKGPEVTERLISGTAFEESDRQLGSGTSAESLEDCLSAGSESNHSAAASTNVSLFGQQRRRSSVCFTPLPPHKSPTLAKRLLRSTNSSSSPVVKPYPPILPSYIKTTTRQLSSPGQSPALSPSHSPLSPRRTHHHLHRYLRCHNMLIISQDVITAHMILCAFK